MEQNHKKMQKEKVRLPFYGIPAIFPFIKPHMKLVLLMIGGIGFGAAVDACIPLFQNYAINHFIGENTLDTLKVFVLLYLVVLLLQCVIFMSGCYVSSKLEVLVDQDVRQACFDHVQTLSFSYFNQNSVGYIHSRMISDPNRIGIIVSWGMLDLVAALVYIAGIFLIMFRLNTPLALLLLCVVPLEMVITWYFQSRLSDANHEVRERNSIITSDYNEGITGAVTIKTLVAEELLLKEFKEDTLHMKEASVHAHRLKSLFQSIIVFVSSIALALVLYRGGHLNQEGLMLVGSLSVFMNYATNMVEYVQDVVNTIANLINSQVNIERIMKLLGTQSDVIDRPEVIEKYGDTFNPKKENWEAILGDIEFQDVSFTYPDGEEEVLTHFNLEVKAGQMVAIVGETGAGKSTLANLVCRFYEPTKGRVLIDGKDARDRSQLWLHSHIGYVLQSPHLFYGSVLDNLRYGNKDASMEEIELACRRVNADKVISRMEKGYDSEVGEGGGLLSTGEKQLLSFARAILANPAILILDEATSSVDTITESIIKDAIKEVTKNRTSFVIAHRLSTIREADMILAMRDGKIVERGTHEELMAAKGYYYSLYTHQFVEDREREVLSK